MGRGWGKWGNGEKRTGKNRATVKRAFFPLVEKWVGFWG